jgi:protein phosphatase
MLGDEQIGQLLGRATSLDAAVRALIDEANRAGGRDNITVVAFRLEHTDEVAAGDGDATLIGPSAEEAGLTSERVRAAAARREAGAEPAEPRRRWKTVAKVLAVVLVVAGIGVAAVLGARQVYFLGIDEGGRVTLYRGLPYDLPFGVELYSEVYSIPVQAASIPEDRRDSLTNHDLRSRDDAVSLLDDLEAAAVAPATPPNSAGGQNATGTGGGQQDGGQQGGATPEGGGGQQSNGGKQSRRPAGGSGN